MAPRTDGAGGPPAPRRTQTLPRRAALGALGVLVAAGGAGFAARLTLGRATAKPPRARSTPAPAAVPTAWTRLSPDETPAAIASPNVPTKGTGQPLQFWHPFGADAGPERAAHAAVWEAFSAAAQRPIMGTAVPSTPSASLQSALATALAAGTPPDAVCLDRLSLSSTFIDTMTTDLAAYGRKDGMTPADYYQHVWDDVHLADHLTATPFGADARGLWWRRDFMVEQQIDPEVGPTTLEALAPLTNGPTTTPKGQRHWGFSPYVGDTHPYTWGIPYRAHWFDPAARRMTAAAAPNIAALTWYAAQVKSGLPLAAPGGPSPLLTGEVRALVDGHWLLSGIAPTQQVLYGAAPLPPAAGQPPTATWSTGYGIAIPRGAKQPERSWAFAAYYAGPAAALAYLGAGGRRVMPAQPGLAAHPAVQAPGKLWQTFLAMLPTAWARPAMPEAGFAWAALAVAGASVRRGEAAPEQALRAVDTNVNAALGNDGW